MTWLSRQELEGMVVVRGEGAAKPVTAVQDCVSSFASVQPLDIF